MSQQSSAQPAFVTSYSPEPEIKDTEKDEKDEPKEPQSLEEALLGE